MPKPTSIFFFALRVAIETALSYACVFSNLLFLTFLLRTFCDKGVRRIRWIYLSLVCPLDSISFVGRNKFLLYLLSPLKFRGPSIIIISAIIIIMIQLGQWTKLENLAMPFTQFSSGVSDESKWWRMVETSGKLHTRKTDNTPPKMEWQHKPNFHCFCHHHIYIQTSS